MTFNTTSFTKRALCGVAAGVFSLSLAAIPAHAQDNSYGDRSYDDGRYVQSSYDDDTVEGITVRPHHRVVGRSAIGAPIEEITASRVVSYRDLDLSTGNDRHILKARIEQAAQSACEELNNRADVLDSDSADCYHDAVRDGLSQVSYNSYESRGYEPRGW